MNETKTIPMGALKLAAEIEKIFLNINLIEEVDFSYKSEEDECIPFTEEQTIVINNYNLEEFSKNILAETNGNKKLSYFVSNVKKEDRKIVYTALLKVSNFAISISNFTPLNVFAYRPICPICSYSNKLIYKIDKESPVCESCGHFFSYNKLCQCNYCKSKLDNLEFKLKYFFLNYGFEFSLVNTISGVRELYILNCEDDVETFLDLYKKSFSNDLNNYFEIGNTFQIKSKEQINDYEYFLTLYNKVSIPITKEVNSEYKYIVVKIDVINSLLIKFDNNGNFISQELKENNGFKK